MLIRVQIKLLSYIVSENITVWSLYHSLFSLFFEAKHILDIWPINQTSKHLFQKKKMKTHTHLKKCLQLLGKNLFIIILKSDKLKCSSISIQSMVHPDHSAVS